MRIALAQFQPLPQQISANLQEMTRLCHAAQQEDCQLILFPELADIGYQLEAVKNHTEQAFQSIVQRLRTLAEDTGLYLSAGICRVQQNQRYNSLVTWAPNGRIAAMYNKIHLFPGQPFNEDTAFSPGKHPVLFTAYGFTFGLALCYDLRFPELFRSMASAGCDTFLLAAAWPKARITHWQTLAAARALENQCFLVGVNQAEAGASLVTGPEGTCLLADTQQKSLLTVSLSKNRILQCREQFFSLKDTRPDAYLPVHKRSPFDDIHKRA